MDFEALRVDGLPVDGELIDAGNVGPELAHLAGVYRRSPRALLWRNPSSDWRLFMLLPPLASRLSLMLNPIFAQLTRAWGLNVRFVGVDRDGLAYDFRNLLSDASLKLLVESLGAHETAHPPVLDALFEALARDMMTVLRRRHRGWERHLDVEHRLESDAPSNLFARATRYPDFIAMLRKALRDEIIDVAFYGRVLRSIDLREAAAEQRIASVVESSLDPVAMAKLARTGAGRHLGCYNWLRLDARHAASRAHVLGELPGFAAFFAATLVPLDAALLGVDDAQAPDGELDANDGDFSAGPRRGAGSRGDSPTLDLRAVAAGRSGPHASRWSELLRRAIDTGQDRAVIEALAGRFGVAENVIRRLWRESPAGFGQPPAWQLAHILRRLDAIGTRDWPGNDSGWRELIAQAVPAEAG
ncbi:MAG: hypothetical protein KJZ83_12775 [Burkholderiaceae bacterium]|nr:hypothetical protein [Burkholderiaceae bacterium]